MNFDVCFALLDIRYKYKEEKVLEKKFIRPLRNIKLPFRESFGESFPKEKIIKKILREMLTKFTTQR